MTYSERKLAGICTQDGCSEPCAEDNCRCERHAEEHRRANREWRARVAVGSPRRRYARRWRQVAMEGIG